MALGRETVGTAYVKILADGSNLDESIKRQIREADDGVRAEGARHGEAYGEEFKKGLSQQKIGQDLRDNLEKSQAHTDLADRYFNSRDWKRFVGRLKKEYGDAGILAGHELQTQFRHNVDEGFKDATRDIGTRVDRIRDEIEKAAEGSREFERRWRADFDKAGVDIDRLRTTFAKDFVAIQKNLRDTKGNARDLVTEFDNGTDRMRRWREEITKGLGVMGRWGQRMESSGGFFARFLRTARETSPVISRMDKLFGSFADGVGKAFGKGSRNDFVNFIGSVVGGLTSLATGVLTKVSGFFIDIGRQAKTAFNAAQEAGDSFFLSLLKGSGAAALSFAELPVTIGAIGLALGALAIALGPIVGLLSLLLGTVIALTASISFGLMGALAPLVGLLAPIAVAAGAVAAAFIGMDDKTKKLMKESIEPLKKDLQDLGAAARPGILSGLQTAVENLRQPVKQLEPLFAAAGDGIATFMGAFTDAITGPGFNRFVTVMTQQLPRELQSLGEALGHVFDGFLGALASLNQKGGPVESFLGWLTGITETFDNWTSKTVAPPSMDLTHAGGRGIKLPSEAAAPQTGFDKWLTGISDSATALKGVLNPLWDIIKTLMNAGKPSGDSMMTSLGDNLQKLSDWLDKHPDDVAQWFSDAEDFADALGDLAVNFGKLVDKVDTPGGRATATFLVRMTSLSLGPAASSILTFSGALEALTNILGKGKFDQIGKIDLTGIFNIKGVPNIAARMIAPFSGLASKILEKIGLVNLVDIISGVQRVAGFVMNPFSGLASKALSKMGTFSLTDIIKGVENVASTIFKAFPDASAILKSMGTFDIMDVVDGLANVATNIFNAFPSASEILASIGHIDLGSLMHGSIDPPGPLGPWRWAEGGIVPFPMHGLIGESGPEAVVPLNRPLHMVDPAVRGLSAIAQGLAGTSGTTVLPALKPTIDASGWTIVSPTKDPAAVAQEVVNRLVAVGY